jgi:hypothetical protein
MFDYIVACRLGHVIDEEEEEERLERFPIEHHPVDGRCDSSKWRVGKYE